MTRRSWSVAVLLGSFSLSHAGAEGIVFSLPESAPGHSYATAFAAPDQFASNRDSTIPSTAIVAPPASLVAPVSTTLPRGGDFGALAPASDHLNNPLGHLTSSSSSIVAATARYESSAASRLSGIPSTGSGLIQRMQMPTASFGPARGELGDNPVMPYVPTATPQIYFGTR